MEIQGGLFPASGPGMLALPTPSLAIAGPTLRAARERLGMSVQDVSSATRITVRHLSAIEEGRFDGFAASIYAIGFARSYARVVGVSLDWINECLRDAVAAQFDAGARNAGQTGRSFSRIRENRRR